MTSLCKLLLVTIASVLLNTVNVLTEWSCERDILSCNSCSPKTVSHIAPDCPGARILNLNKNKLTSLKFPRQFIRKYANASLWLADNNLSSLQGLNDWHGPGLILDKNIFTFLDSKILGGHLEYLSVDDNSLPVLDLSPATHLQAVSAKAACLEEIRIPNPCVISRMNLEENSLDSVPQEILRCTRLRDLHLSNNVMDKMPESLVELLTLRNTSWTSGDLQEEISVKLTKNTIPASNVIQAFQRFHKECQEITVYPVYAECECAVVRTADRNFATVKYCISSMCSKGLPKWNDILQE